MIPVKIKGERVAIRIPVSIFVSKVTLGPNYEKCIACLEHGIGLQPQSLLACGSETVSYVQFSCTLKRKTTLTPHNGLMNPFPRVITVEMAIMNQVIMNQFDSESILALTELGDTKKTVCDVEYMW